MANENLADLLAMLCRKGFGETPVRRVVVGKETTTTIRGLLSLAEKEDEDRPGTEYGCEPHKGKLLVFFLPPDWSGKPLPYAYEVDPSDV